MKKHLCTLSALFWLAAMTADAQGYEFQRVTAFDLVLGSDMSEKKKKGIFEQIPRMVSFNEDGSARVIKLQAHNAIIDIKLILSSKSSANTERTRRMSQVRENDAIVSAELTRLSGLGWELVDVQTEIANHNTTGYSSLEYRIVMTRFLFRREKEVSGK